MRKTKWKALRAPLTVMGVGFAALLISDVSNAQVSMEYGADLRYRYEWFDINETSKASTLRLGLKAKASVGDYFSGFAELEAVEQFNDGYNVPTVPAQNKPDYPVIADPRGTEMNQAYLQYADPAGLHNCAPAVRKSCSITGALSAPPGYGRTISHSTALP